LLLCAILDLQANGCGGDGISLRVTNPAAQRSGFLRLQRERKQAENKRGQTAAAKTSEPEFPLDCAATGNAEKCHEEEARSDPSELGPRSQTGILSARQENCWRSSRTQNRMQSFVASDLSQAI
jgi:hypothetical protein